MQIQKFKDEYELAAEVYDRTPDELRRRDEQRGQPLRRWLALANNRTVAAVSAWLRPDDRMFLHFVGQHPEGYERLAEAARESLGHRVHTIVDAAEVDTVAAFEAAAFRTELVADKFRIRFDDALARLDRAWVPSGLCIRSADDVEEDRLFALDNTLRQDVPGTDGWRGDRQWFHDELAEAPPFDPSGYLVAIDDGNGDYIGLARIWRNPDGPRLGLIGVVRHYRNTVIAAALLKNVLTAASSWGHTTFTTEASVGNRAIHPRLSRIGAEHEGRFLQLVRP